jgi:hypothetical protein
MYFKKCMGISMIKIIVGKDTMTLTQGWVIACILVVRIQAVAVEAWAPIPK